MTDVLVAPALRKHRCHLLRTLIRKSLRFPLPLVPPPFAEPRHPPNPRLQLYGADYDVPKGPQCSPQLIQTSLPDLPYRMHNGKAQRDRVSNVNIDGGPVPEERSRSLSLIHRHPAGTIGSTSVSTSWFQTACAANHRVAICRSHC